MLTVSLLAVLLPVLVCGIPYPQPHSGIRVKPTTDISAEYIKILRAFNRQNVQAVSFSGSTRTKEDAVFSDPVSLGALWATLNERAFDIETVEIHRALGLIPEEIPKVYGSISNFLHQNASILTNNAIFTRRENLPLTAGLQNLQTTIETVDFRPENLRGEVVHNISKYLAEQTNHEISDELLPQLDPPMEKSTDSVVLSTMSYVKKFSRPLPRKKGLMFYVSPEEMIMVDSIEFTGDYQVYETETWRAIVLPFDEEERNNLIFVQSDNLPRFFRHDYEAFSGTVDSISRYTTNSDIPLFERRRLRVRLPVVNLTIARRYIQEVEPVGEMKPYRARSAICDTTTDHQEFLQTPVQVTKVHLSEDSLSVSTAIGVQVDNVKEYKDELLALPRARAMDAMSMEFHLTTEAPTPEYKPAQHSYQAPNGDIYIPVEIRREPKYQAYDAQADEEPVYEDVVLNKPFFMAVHEYNVGMFNFLAVRHPSRGRSDKGRFSEYAKLKRWLCTEPLQKPTTSQ